MSFETICSGCGAVSGPSVGVCPFCKSVMATPGKETKEFSTLLKLWSEGKTNLALPLAATLAKEKPDLNSNFEFLLTYAKILIEVEGPSSQIRTLLSRAHFLQPENQDVIDYLAFTEAVRHFKQGADEAETILNQILKRSPTNAHVHFALGAHLFWTEKTYPAAIAHLERCVQLRPSFLRAWGALGALYRQIGKSDLAARAFQTCLKLETNPSMIEFFKGQLKTVA